MHPLNPLNTNQILLITYTGLNIVCNLFIVAFFASCDRLVDDTRMGKGEIRSFENTPYLMRLTEKVALVSGVSS